MTAVFCPLWMVELLKIIELVIRKEKVILPFSCQ